MKRIAIVATVVGLALVAASVVYAGGWGRGGWGRAGGCYGYSQMSPEQRAAWSQYLNETLSLRQQLAAKRMELHTLMAQPNPDQARIEQLNKEIGELSGKLATYRLRLRERLGNAAGTGTGVGAGGSPQALGPCGGGMGPRGAMWR